MVKFDSFIAEAARFLSGITGAVSFWTGLAGRGASGVIVRAAFCLSSIRERGQVPYGGTVAERASVPVVKAASIHHEQTPLVRTERQIVPSASLSQSDGKV